MYFLKDNLFGEFLLQSPALLNLKKEDLQDLLTTSSSLTYVFFFLQIATFTAAFFIFTLIFSRLYRIIFDLVEVLLYMEPLDLQIVKQATRAFLDLVERSSVGAVSGVKDSFDIPGGLRARTANKKKTEVLEGRSDIPASDVDLLNYVKNRRLS